MFFFFSLSVGLFNVSSKVDSYGDEMWELGNMVYLAVATTYNMPKSKVGEGMAFIAFYLWRLF